jgi:aldehyde:ferredoxin oxidoreductase
MPRAAQILETGREYLTHIAHGFVEHIVGRGIQTTLPFPQWITSALIWATESRDPVSELHSSTRISTSRGLTQQQARVLSQQIYGTKKTVDPTYEYKAPRAIWHQNRGCAKDSLVLCDAVYPIVSSEMTEDRSGYTAAESELLSAITGVELSERDLNHIGERIFNLERAIMVREGRSKDYDLNCGVVNYLHTRPDTDGIYLEKSRFVQSLDEFYHLRGWDIATGWPTESKLKSLSLSAIALELKKLGRLPC